MNQQRKRRLFLILWMMGGIGLAVGLVLYALQQNINLYYTPSQLSSAHLAPQQIIRIGGLVEKGSVHYAAKGLAMNFVLTDQQQQLVVDYSGVLPVLFREGQGVVAQGKLTASGVFVADQILAKHDAKYQPPKLAMSP